MRETLYRVADARAWERLLSAGIPIVHRFPDAVVLREPLDEDIDGVTLVEPGVAADADRPDASLGEQAFARRQTEEFRTRKAQRPDVGLGFDEIIRRDRQS